jgi:hypothetical protein
MHMDIADRLLVFAFTVTMLCTLVVLVWLV